MQWLKGKKTYLVSAAMIFASLIHLLGGDMTLAEFLNHPQLQTLLEGLGLGTLRAGMAKNNLRSPW